MLYQSGYCWKVQHHKHKMCVERKEKRKGPTEIVDQFQVSLLKALHLDCTQ